jgi:hypothetical protein
MERENIKVLKASLFGAVSRSTKGTPPTRMEPDAARGWTTSILKLTDVSSWLFVRFKRGSANREVFDYFYVCK